MIRGDPSGFALVGGALAAAPVAVAAALVPSTSAWILVAAVVAVASAEIASAPATDSVGQGIDTTLARVTALGLCGIWVAAALVARPEPGWMLVVGLVLLAMGAGLRVAALRALGDRFCSQVRAAPSVDLVEGSIYAWMRHPSELGTTLLAVGAVVMTGRLSAVAIAVAAFVPLIVVRVAREERDLRAVFGARHAAYRSRVGLLVPKRRWLP